jgi:thiamine pyrophosphokinase
VKTVVVIAAGPEVPASLPFPPGALVIGADGGAGLGVPVDLAVGDFDSLAADALAGLGRVERHPAEKDATDLELALDAALREQPERILVVGSAGGRLDHLFGSLLLLAADAYSGVQVDAQLGAAAVHVVRGARTLRGEPGELVSLFAVHGAAHGVTTAGLVYPLNGESLEPGSSRGTSNVFLAAEARVSVADGVVVAVRPTGSCAAGTAS